MTTQPVHPESSWYSDEQCARVAALATEVREAGTPGVAVEVGTWTGKSTIAIAGALAPHPLFVVDHWQGNPEAPETLQLAKERDVYAEFRANIAAAGLTNVVVRRMDWRDWAKTATERRFSFVHLDAGHDLESVRDQVLFFLPRMSSGGILCGDDWSWESVRAGLEAAGLSVSVNGNFWWRRA